MKGSNTGYLIAAIGVATLLTSTVTAAESVLSDPLVGGTSGTAVGGEFTADGWKAPHQIWWDLGQEITAGGMSVELLN